MTVLDYILDGLEAELALERELGIRAVECDRGVLAVSVPEVKPVAAAVAKVPPRPAVTARPTLTPSVAEAAETGTCHDIAFLHDRPLTQEGAVMMAKIVAEMSKTADIAPIAFSGERPPARVYVVLGGNALKKWFPGVPGGPGQWISQPGVRDVLVTYSPAYILRFGTVTPAVQKLKRDMWTSLKGALQRAAQRKEMR